MARKITQEDVDKYGQIQKELNDVLQYGQEEFFSYFDKKNAKKFIEKLRELYELYNTIMEGTKDYPPPQSVVFSVVFTTQNSGLRSPAAILSQIRAKFFGNENFFGNEKITAIQSALEKLDSDTTSYKITTTELEEIDKLSLGDLPNIYKGISVLVDILNQLESFEGSEISPQETMYPLYEQLSNKLVDIQGKIYAQAILNGHDNIAKKVKNSFDNYLDSIIPLAKVAKHESLIEQSHQQFNAQLVIAYKRAIKEYKTDYANPKQVTNDWLKGKLQEITALYTEMEKLGIDPKQEKLENPESLKITLELRIKCIDELKKVIEGINKRDTPEAKTMTKIWDSVKDTIGKDDPETRASRREAKKVLLEGAIESIIQAKTPEEIHQVLQSLKETNGTVGSTMYTNDLRLKLSGPVGNTGIIAEAEKSMAQMESVVMASNKSKVGELKS